MLSVRRESVSIFLLAMSVLMLEVALTRVFSVMSWHHFAYLIISLAFLGFGAAGSFLTVSPRFAGRDFDGKLAGRYSLAFSAATLLGFATATKIRFYPMDAYFFGDYSNAFSLLLLYVVMAAPFFFAGVCIGHIITRAGEAINTLYFADLLGAGTGTLLSVAGINYLGAEATIYFAAAASGFVAVLYSLSMRQVRLLIAAASFLSMLILMSVVASRQEIFPIYFPPEKIFRAAMLPHYYRWHTVARVDIMNPEVFPMDFGGALSPRYQGGAPALRVVWQDGTAPTGIINVPNGDIGKLPILAYYLQSAPYVIKQNAQQGLVIGVGGGCDVLIALYNGVRHVVGVEINPVTADAVKNRYADFAGRIFDRPDTELIVAEGRHYLTTTSRRFDVIQLSGVDTYSALATGAYALAENYLYTTGAMQDYWEHLSENGVLSFSRWLFNPPRETLRLVATQLEILQGINPQEHFIIIAGRTSQGEWAETLLKKSPFTLSETVAYRRWADALGFSILYDPFQDRANAFNAIIHATDVERAEMIERYPYNIKPTTDDDPFFFQFYRWRSLFSPMKSEGGFFIEQIPLGLAVLSVSLAQILLLAGALIIAPLLLRGGELRKVRHKGGILLYFSALGLGFIFVEITLLQKYTVFVGGPIYSMAITLFAILVFSGLGSLIAKRLQDSISFGLTAAILALVVAILLETIFVNQAIPRLMFLPHWARCAVTVAALAPLALMMGMPFPMGLRAVQRIEESVVPWAWGVNAFTTTLGSVLCIFASMQWGFTACLLAAAGMYLAGLAGLRSVARSAAESV